MLKGICSSSHSWGDNTRFLLLFALIFPFALTAAALHRLIAPADRHVGTPLFASARESASIAVSYATMAKTTVQRSVRHPRAERQS